MSTAVQGFNANMHASIAASGSGGRRPDRGNGGLRPPDRGLGKVTKKTKKLPSGYLLPPSGRAAAAPSYKLEAMSHGTSAGRAAAAGGAGAAGTLGARPSGAAPPAAVSPRSAPPALSRVANAASSTGSSRGSVML
ncbi:hypothetical protein IFM58399_06376 [Aspergillus lentulus]|uniref:Uncharacterized protein n=1 Tax=Aspergillus lentulus TaxID=293939 RepID=A0ABQ1ALG2_ASPLE|nr:uncharacterized protein IFM58399_06376 [Aspergillus lentulus]GFF41762.1 hypothetical protein IFM58399_06376 [Aspergillus lentulus]GFF78626.1 hypothetical protein IFM62136_09862 [Aspergillus lentulus]GFF84062.1 hypothetical protein IFM60648_06904 [Aspergillus lentulus]GFF96110.1 hypothetical protein IFM47457_10711 [Aspergillus lentulus]GFG17357.1 hypothetical protein IFM61392_09992 [Aspergillus lentulus]